MTAGSTDTHGTVPQIVGAYFGDVLDAVQSVTAAEIGRDGDPCGWLERAALRYAREQVRWSRHVTSADPIERMARHKRGAVDWLVRAADRYTRELVRLRTRTETRTYTDRAQYLREWHRERRARLRSATADETRGT